MKHNKFFYLTHPKVGIPALLAKVSDRYAIKQKWLHIMGYSLDLKHPKTIGEKLQWLKLYDRKPEYTIMADKYRAKQFVANKIGKQYIVPILAVYDSVDDIDIDKLPDKFVLKCNHDWHSVVICKDKASFDLDKAKLKLRESFNNNYYKVLREWPYKNIKRCVFAEEYLENIDGEELHDYKFHTFEGEPKFYYVTSNNGGYGMIKNDYFGLEGNLLEFNQKGREGNQPPPSKPKNLKKMIEISRELAKGTHYLRVDFYEVRNKLYVGELTFYHCGGFCEFTPEKYNRIIGDWIKLPIDR